MNWDEFRKGARRDDGARENSMSRSVCLKIKHPQKAPSIQGKHRHTPTHLLVGSCQTQSQMSCYQACSPILLPTTDCCPIYGALVWFQFCPSSWTISWPSILGFTIRSNHHSPALRISWPGPRQANWPRGRQSKQRSTSWAAHENLSSGVKITNEPSYMRSIHKTSRSQGLYICLSQSWTPPFGPS